jgi:hypothetical protein
MPLLREAASSCRARPFVVLHPSSPTFVPPPQTPAYVICNSASPPLTELAPVESPLAGPSPATTSPPKQIKVRPASPFQQPAQASLPSVFSWGLWECMCCIRLNPAIVWLINNQVHALLQLL